MKKNGGFLGHTKSLNLLWSLKLRGSVTECISIIKNIGHSTWKVQHCRRFSPRPGSPLRTESACGVWWWPWCRWSPGQWWCHFCSCLFARKLDGHVLTAAPAPTHTHKQTQHHEQRPVTGKQRNPTLGDRWKYENVIVGQMCKADVTVSDTGSSNHHSPCGN